MKVRTANHANMRAAAAAPWKGIALGVLVAWLLPAILFWSALQFTWQDSNVDLANEALQPIYTTTLLSINYYVRKLQIFSTSPGGHVMELASGFITSKAIYTVCALGVPDLLRSGPLTIIEIASKTNTIPDRLERTLRHLSVYDIFIKIDGRWHNTKLSGILRRDHPNSIADAVMHLTDEVYEAFSDLDRSITLLPSPQRKSQVRQTNPKKNINNIYKQLENSSHFAISNKLSIHPDIGNSNIDSESSPTTSAFRHLEKRHLHYSSNTTTNNSEPPTAWHLRYGTQTFAEWLGQPPQKMNRERYIKAMRSLPHLANAGLISDFEWDKFNGKSICDIGGGNGVFLAYLLQAYPNLRGILYDLPEVIVNAEQEWKKKYPAELLQRVQFIGGNYFDNVPAGADIYHIRNVLRDLSDDDTTHILKVIYDQMAHDNTLSTAAILWTDRELFMPLHPLTSLLDMQALSMTNGKERSHDEKLALMRVAGFEYVEAARTRAMFSILQCKPITGLSTLQ